MHLLPNGYTSNLMSKSLSLLQMHCLKPVRTFPFSRRPRNTKRSPQRLHRMSTFVLSPPISNSSASCCDERRHDFSPSLS